MDNHFRKLITQAELTTSERLTDCIREVFRKLDKPNHSKAFQSCKYAIAVHVACRMLKLPCSIDRFVSLAGLSEKDYIKELDIAKASLNITWETVDIESIRTMYNDDMADHVLALVRAYKPQVNFSHYSESKYYCAAAYVVNQSITAANKDKEQLRRMCEMDTKKFSDLCSSLLCYTKDPENIKLIENELEALHSAGNKDPLKATDNRKPTSKGALAVSSLSSSSNSSSSSSVARSSSSLLTKRLAMERQDSKGSKQSRGAGFGLGAAARMEEEQGERARMAVNRKREAYVIWRESILKKHEVQSSVAECS